MYCLKCIKNKEIKNPKVPRTKNGRIMFLSKCEVCDSKKSKFIKQQKASGLLGNFGKNTPLKHPFSIRSFFCFRGINNLMQDIK